jgi:hypothetical protein
MCNSSGDILPFRLVIEVLVAADFDMSLVNFSINQLGETND